MTYFPFWLWLPLVGFEPYMVILAQAWSLIYQFGIHTERVRGFPRPVEFFFNTPSHHRVHHGVNEQYLDRNYGGILIIWDRMFGTFEPEGERVRYGLTTQLKTFRPLRQAPAPSSAFSSTAPAGRHPASPRPRRPAGNLRRTLHAYPPAHAAFELKHSYTY